MPKSKFDTYFNFIWHLEEIYDKFDGIIWSKNNENDLAFQKYEVHWLLLRSFLSL